MNLVNENGQYYLIDGEDKSLIDSNLVTLFKEAYGENIPSSRFDYLKACNRVNNLDKSKFAVKFQVIQDGVGLSAKAIGEDGSLSKMRASDIWSAVALQETLLETNMAQEASMKPMVQEVSEKPKVKFFAGAKKQVSKKFKIVRNAVFAGLVAGTVALGALYAPYALNEQATDDFVSNHTVEQVITEDVSLEEAYSACPYTFEGDVVAYLDSPELFGGVYPVAQSASDNYYYLSHDINGNYSSQGSIYKDSRNAEGLSNDFNIIYGHNLMDDSKFGKLSEYADKNVATPFGEEQVRDADALYNETNTIDYYDEYGHYQIEIIASGVYDSNEIYNWAGNYANEEDFQLKKDLMFGNSDIDTGYDLGMDDKIIAFQSCPDMDATDYNDVNRVYVFGVAHELEKYKDLPTNALESSITR